MNGKELKFEETEAPHTLGGSGEGRVQGRGQGRGCGCDAGFKHCNTLKNVYSPEFSFYLRASSLRCGFWVLFVHLFFSVVKFSQWLAKMVKGSRR